MPSRRIQVHGKRLSAPPELEAVVVEVPSLVGPYGTKPVGELPLTSERVRRAMHTESAGGRTALSV